jgi:ABC-type multidrug transport system fused ATPase/permease subunit
VVGLSLRRGTGPEDDSGASDWSSLKFLVGDHRASVAGIAATAVFAGIAEAGILAAVAQVAAVLLAEGDSVHVAVGPLSGDISVGGLLGIAAALVVFRVSLQGGSAALQSRLAANVQADLRTRLFGSFTRASWGFRSSDREGHLQEMLTSQVVQATAGTLQLAGLISALITFGVLVLSAMLLNLLAATVVIGVSATLFTILRPLSSLGQRRAKDLSRAQMEFAGSVGEAVRMAEETQVFGVEAVQRARVGQRVAASRALYVRTQLINRLVPNLFQNLIYLTVVAGLGALYFTGAGQVASLGAVILMMVRAGSYGQQAQGGYQSIRQALPFIERLRQATMRYEANRKPIHDRPLEGIETVAFEGVSYAYRPGQPVLSEIDFHTSRGEAIGIVGPSGAGKSTLVQILLQLREPDGGTYSINGVPAGAFDPTDWHRLVAYVPQTPQLLHASVAENIRYFREIDDATVERAARLARIDEDIRKWRNDYETVIGPRADSISGGQQQRICLARALASRPGMLVLDEPTSSLDPRSEALIQESLGEIARELTLVVVTHRMSMLAVCDRVLVIVDGRVAGFGQTHVLRETNEYFSAA